MDSSENRAGDPPHPPASETPAPAAVAVEGTRSQNNVPSGTYFGLKRSQPQSWGVGATPRDYKARYPPDPHGQEMSENARIWPIYNEEAADFDANMLAEWRDTIDVLLVFAGLFSAVLTTFVVQTSQNMQLDYNQASMLLLFEILKATTSNGSQISIPSSPTAFFSPNRSDEWMNSLWFVSLSLNLITALVAVLVKQWLHQYIDILSDGSARDRARIRHLRYAGLQTWQVPMIIGLLPVLLHVSLALFFAGLVIFLFSLGMKVAWLVSIIGAATYMAYVIALILPLIHPYCPYKVPLTLYVHRLYQYIHPLYQYAGHLYQYGNSYLIRRIRYCIRFMRHYLYTRVFSHYHRRGLNEHRIWWEDSESELETLETLEQLETQESLTPFPQKPPTLKEIEHNHIQQYATMTDAQSLLWLHSSTSNSSVHQSVLQAISGMTPDTLECLPDKFVFASVISLRQQIEHIKRLALSPGANSELNELKLYCRALILLCGHLTDESFSEQLKVVLYSMAASEEASSVFLEIFRAPQRSSLTLQPAMWKILADIAISSPPLCSSALGLELELMKCLASPSTTSDSEETMTIDNLTDEVRGYIYDKLLACWGYDLTQTPSSIRTTHHDLGIMLSLIPRIYQRLLDSSHASDRKEVIETAVAIIEGIVLLILQSLPGEAQPILDTFSKLFPLLSSESEASDVDVEIFARGISMIFCPLQSQWIRTVSRVMDFSSEDNLDFLPEYLKARVRAVDLQQWLLIDPSYSGMEINTLVDIILFLIDRHRERILYMWVDCSTMQNWKVCVSRLIQWASGEDFRQRAFLKRVLAIAVIGELQRKLGSSDVNERLPRYDNEALMEVNQLPWLREIPPPGSSSDGAPNRLEYSLIAAHPKFWELLDQEDVANHTRRNPRWRYE